jgi:hypothetical protein
LVAEVAWLHSEPFVEPFIAPESAFIPAEK